MTDAAFTGHLKRGDAEGTIVGFIQELPWGWTIHLTGTRDPNGGYLLTGRLGKEPPGLHIEGLDGEAKEEAAG